MTTLAMAGYTKIVKIRVRKKLAYNVIN